MEDRNGVILQLYSRAHAPNRDYYGLTISNQDVILNVWNITHGPHIFPKKQKCPLEDISISKTLLSEIQRLFGDHVLEFTLALGRGEARLECLPTKLFLKVLRYLAANDILKLGQSSKIFFELCNRNNVWEIIFRKRNRGAPSRDEVKAANQKSWKIVLKNKLVWAERLHRTGKDKPTIETKLKEKDSSKRVTSAHKQSESKTSLTSKKPGVKVPELEKLQLLDNPNDIKTKSIFTTKHLNEAVATLEASKVNKSSMKLVSKPTRETVNANVNVLNASKVPSIEPVRGLPVRGILKRSCEDLLQSKTHAMVTISERQEPTLTKIEYRPLSKTRLTVPTKNPLSSMSNTQLHKGSINSMLSGILSKDRSFSASDRHLDRFLMDLDKKSNANPFKLDPKLLEVPPVTSKTTRAKTTAFKSNFSRNQDKLHSTADDVKMTSKFEDYLKTLQGRSVHPDVGFELRKDAGKTTLSKADLVAKISELGKSLNQIRSSFYSGDKSKVRLNNSKMTNHQQQLNNKLNTTMASTSVLEMKKNAIKSNVKSTTAINNAVKVKNTNCAPPVHKYAKAGTPTATIKTAKK